MTKVIGFGLIATAITVITYSILGFPKMEVSLLATISCCSICLLCNRKSYQKDYKSSLMSTFDWFNDC